MYNKTPRTDRKFNKSRNWLYEEYVVKNRSLSEVASDCGLTSSGLKNALSKYGITKPKVEIPVSELTQYLEEGKSVKKICEIYDCNNKRIYAMMKVNNLTIHYKPDFKQYDDTKDEIICSLYLDGFSPEEIGREIGVSRTSVKNHLKHCGIVLRSYVDAQFAAKGKTCPEDLKDYNTVYDLYVNQRMSKKDLGFKYNVDPGTINRVLKNFNISVRNNSEAKIGHKTGDTHPNWRGGLTSIYMRLRTAFEVQLKPKAEERDNHTCQICGSRENICVHHKRSFREIVDEIIGEHPELDTKDNVNELYDIAVQDNRFTDLDNLITCCKDCHLYVLHGYHKRNN